MITFVSELLSVLFASISTAAQNLSKLFTASYYYKNIIRFYCRIVFPPCHPLTNNLQVTLLTLHWVGVDLAHVPSPVSFSNFPDMKIPYSMIAVRHRYPMVLGDHVTMNSQYGLGVHSQPSNLKVKLNYDKSFHQHQYSQRYVWRINLLYIV